ncbi:Retrotransposon gag protein [Gossypium australe]|uniref:Retrotransposon gag protein n=1 Tax=Gossypium australe TaxID=47621 RepID=A0A5B6VWT5_9ROSI|nr:Retrotransposon gag protein [Gossypium australe]
MLRKCPNHGLQSWLQIQIFYNSVDRHIRSSVDRASNGSLMFHTYERACKIIDDMTKNSYIVTSKIQARYYDRILKATLATEMIEKNIPKNRCFVRFNKKSTFMCNLIKYQFM